MCGDTQRLHWQFCVGFEKKVRLRTVKTVLETKYMPNCAGVMQLIITYGKTTHLRGSSLGIWNLGLFGGVGGIV